MPLAAGDRLAQRLSADMEQVAAALQAQNEAFTQMLRQQQETQQQANATLQQTLTQQQQQIANLTQGFSAMMQQQAQPPQPPAATQVQIGKDDQAVKSLLPTGIKSKSSSRRPALGLFAGVTLGDVATELAELSSGTVAS